MNKYICIIFMLLIIPLGYAGIEPHTIYGGETHTIYEYDLDKKCERAIVDVTSDLRIENTNGVKEYNLNDCIHATAHNNFSDNWNCNCTNGEFNLVLTTLISTINNYNFNISFYIKNDTKEQTITTSSLGRNFNYRRTTGEICNPEWECSEWSECLPAGYQTTKCIDINGCEEQRQQTRQCEYKDSDIEETEDNTPKQSSEQGAKPQEQERENNRITGMAVGGEDSIRTGSFATIGLIAIAAGIVIYYGKYKK